MPRQKRTAAPEPEEHSTALALPDTPALIAAYDDPSRMDAILERIETDVRAVMPDVSTAASRKAIASMAYKVARSKTALDEVGKTLTEEARAKIKAVDAKRRNIRERLDTLKLEVRKPLDEWEAAEAERVADLEDRLKDFTDDLPGFDATSVEIAETLEDIDAIPVDETWQEFQARAEAAKTGTMNVLRDMLDKAKAREAEQAELERLRAEAAAREEEDRKRAAAERARAEEERREREKREAAERAAKAAEERAARAMQEAEERHKREIEQERQRAEFAANEERNRQARIRAAEQEARAAREADQARRAEVREAIANSLRRLLEEKHPGDDMALVFTDEVMAGRVPYVKVEM